MRRFPFHVMKTIQAACVILQKHSDSMSYLRLIKLLYIADRESVRETGHPITGGRQVVMDHGPVHSRVFDMIRGCDIAAPDWQRFITKVDYRVRLEASPGVGKLTSYEAGKLAEICDRYANADDWAIVEETHTFEEVARNTPEKGSVKDIPMEDLLRAVGRAADTDAIDGDIAAAADMSAALQDHQG